MSCQIVLTNPSGIYFPGNTIEGKVICTFNKKKNIKGIRWKLRGKEMTSFSHFERSKREKLSGKNKFIMGQVTFVGEGRIGPGTFEYPFQFVLPKACPSSYKSRHGMVWYYLKAVVDRNHKSRNYEIKTDITVTAPINLNHIPNLDMSPSTYQDEMFPQCGCFKNGPITLTVYLDKSAYVLGETISFKVHVFNASNINVKKLTAKLISNVQEKATTPRTDISKTTEELIASRTETGVGSHGQRNYALSLPIPGDTTIPNFSMCTLFQQWCNLKVIAELASWDAALEVSTFIILGHVPLRPQRPPAPAPPTVVIHAPSAPQESQSVPGSSRVVPSNLPNDGAPPSYDEAVGKLRVPG